MQKIVLSFLLICLTAFVNAQEVTEVIKDSVQNDTILMNLDQKLHYLRGRIISIEDNNPLQSAHVVNLNTVDGTITNNNGQFEIPATVNDTIFISYIGFQSIKLKITNDLLKGNELEIAIHEKVVNIQEVTVKSHKLIGVLVVDSKNVPADSYSRIHINGLPQAYEMGNSYKRNYNSGLGAIFNPVDFWYNKFGKKPKEMDRLRKLKEGDRMRKMMEQ